MFSWHILGHLLVHSFSMDSASLRYPGKKRIIAVVLIWAFFLVHVPFTWFCLWLDRVFFPGFRDIEVRGSLFIVGLPRSGTSFLLESLGGDTDTFTSFQLWEMIFAPSIVQKKAWLEIQRLDQQFEGIGRRIVQRIEQLFFGRMEGVHSLRFNSLEEDEFLFVYLFRSIYLAYLFPELDAEHGLLEVDGEGREAALRFYKACVQRHLYVFDPEGQKIFLSKNPGSLTRLGALQSTFKEGRFIHLSRPVEQVAPSTLSLNSYLLSFFTENESNPSTRIETLRTLVNWDQHLEVEGRGAHWLKVSFKALTCMPSNELRRMYTFLGREVNAEIEAKWEVIDQQSKAYKSSHQYPPLTEEERRVTKQTQQIHDLSSRQHRPFIRPRIH